ncbi:MAG: hypothetical protein V7L01_21175 [Nostoc sp.]
MEFKHLHQWQNSGAIAADSIPKEGTMFVVTLPLQAEWLQNFSDC